MEVKQEIVEIINRQKIEKYTIINDNGVQVGLLTLGATWQEFLVPDDKGGQKNLSSPKRRDIAANCVR